MIHRFLHCLPYVGLSLLGAAFYACSSDSVSSPRPGSGGSSSTGSGGTSFTGTGGNSSTGSGGTSFNGSGGTTSAGTGGTSFTGSGGTSSAGTGGTSSAGTGGTAFTGTGGSAGSGFVGSGGTAAGAGGTVGTTGAGGTTGTGNTMADSLFAMNGYGMSGAWKGYASTAAYGPVGGQSTATITPVCGSGGPCFMTALAKLCVSGSVGADSTQMSGALLGWNLNQPTSGGVAATVATTGTGVTVTVSGNVGGFRIQLQDSTTSKQWCYPIPAGTTGAIPVMWSQFRTACYLPVGDPMSIAYTVGTPIDTFQIIVPSNNSTTVPFDFCLVNVVLN